CRYARHEKVFTAAQHVECLDAVKASSGWLLRDSENRAFLLPSDDWIPLAADPHEIAVIDPLLLQEFHRGHRLSADAQNDGATRSLIICVGQRVRIVRFSIRRAAPDEPMYIDIGQPGKLRVPRVHAPDMASEWCLPAVWIVRIIEVVVPLRV